MSDQPIGTCVFYKQTKPVSITYLKPKNYVKPLAPENYLKLYNGGDYFLRIETCFDCGLPK